MKKLLLAMTLLFAGCCTLQEDYIRQDRKDFATFTPRIKVMIAETTKYDAAQKQDMLDRLTARDLRITEAEAYIKGKKDE